MSCKLCCCFHPYNNKDSQLVYTTNYHFSDRWCANQVGIAVLNHVLYLLGILCRGCCTKIIILLSKLLRQRLLYLIIFHITYYYVLKQFLKKISIQFSNKMDQNILTIHKFTPCYLIQQTRSHAR